MTALLLVASQLRLKEILASCAKHGSNKANLRVRFFMRACGLVDPLPPEYLSFYLSVVESVMVDQLHVRLRCVSGACESRRQESRVSVRTARCYGKTLTPNAIVGVPAFSATKAGRSGGL